ncbi:ribosomal protection-like ABC-F family protein [Metabacillus lacus]|uniref:ribosomal protection-like ABC-F family protein n=1 Tax=Metabacillus lacus TaxID=1983721 RepID=UPI001FE5F704|nr:ABC-F family ATP-binding cassette domain-containing protein [Metabacillus lacus]
MKLICAKNIHKRYGEKTVLKEIDAEIYEGDKIGLVGSNGSGKSTLAGILARVLEQDEGTIEFSRKGMKIGYLRQALSRGEEHAEGDLHSLYELTSQLGLKKACSWDENKLKHVSGGERLKLELAKVWSSDSDLLILDEPTNHMDLEGVQWLMKEIRGFKGAVIIISHDRYLLDHTVSKIFELQDRYLTVFKGNYEAYKQQKQRLLNYQKQQYDIQQQQVKKVEQQISTLNKWSEKGHRESTKKGTPSERRQIGYKEYHRAKAKKMDKQIQSKLKRLQQELQERQIIKPIEEDGITICFQDNGKKGKRLIQAEKAEKSFGSQNLFTNSSFYINQGERVALIGRNGTGKTTLLNILMEADTLDEGTIWKSEAVETAYLTQDTDDLPLTKTALEILNLVTKDDYFRARTVLANLGLDEDSITKPIETLSHGERTRLKLGKMMLNSFDLLILDEPTNHLDLASREQL